MAEIDESALWLMRYRITDLVGGAGGEVAWDRLDLEVPHQEQTNWCWAATSDGVANYYERPSRWTQCAIANSDLGRNDCCGGGASGACNTYGYLDAALTTVGHYDHMAQHVATFGTVKAEIGGQRPLGIRVAWAGGGAHFLAVGGYRDDTDQYVHVEDPWYGPSDLAYATLESAYQGTGTWTHTYWTKA